MGIAVVSGAIANKQHNGGATWTRLSWVLGLKKLGFQVCFVEQIRSASCVDAAGRPAPFGTCENRAYFRRVVDEFGLSGWAALVCEETRETEGLEWSRLLEVAGEAELLVNITGHLTLKALRQMPRQVYIDLDPGYTQFWHAAGGGGARLEGHEHYFTVGENIGTPACAIPTGGIRWRPIRQPVVLEHWPVTGGVDPSRFTTVASWRGPYGSVSHDGRQYGLKVHQFRKFIELPERVPQTFEIALDIHPADRNDHRLLQRHGWHIKDPKMMVPGPEEFRRYVQASGAEFSVAQGVYVETESGWFSDRTVRYLATGKPTLVQDTGFSRNYPVGEGLVAFRTLEEAVVGAQDIAGDYEKHSRAARALAEQSFDSDKVLGRFLEEVNASP
jgi:hypothetical protein